MTPNQSVETNRRFAYPFDVGRQFGSAACAPPSRSAAVAHLSRWAALPMSSHIQTVKMRAIDVSDREWAASVVAQHFGTPAIVSRGVRHDTRSLPGLLAEADGERFGLVHYSIVGTRCEVVALVVLRQRQGLGRRILHELELVARRCGCNCLWLVTTNDNRPAQEFYERLDWQRVAVHRGAVTVARRLKPEIPERADDGTPIEDEIEYELRLDTA